MIPERIDNILPLVQKPARYTGGEVGAIYKNKTDVNLRFAFCFPDTYEIGMSHLGMKILYGLLNSREDTWCERVFTPWTDMQEQMKENDIKLYGLESFDALDEFDIIGFTLQYELSYTNILNMLDLGGIPIYAKDRTNLSGLVIAGGPCSCNPEPLVDFVDVFFLGESEQNLMEFCDLYGKAKAESWSKKEFLRVAGKIKGIYVSEMYDVEYCQDGTVKQVMPRDGAPFPVPKAIVEDLDGSYYPEEFVVPFIDIVHDRAMMEMMRGCIRGCRFCQAGFIYRPMREKSAEKINSGAKVLCESTGYDEVSLSSLSTSDYSDIEPLLDEMLEWTQDEKVNMSLPSLRVDNFSEELLEKVKKVRKSGLTFAPEAGTQRMRDVINKNVSQEEIIKTCRMAFEGGYTSVKLYFMLGLPTETDEDILGILETAKMVVDLFYEIPNRPKGKGVNVGVSVATFVPKPFTPFQFEPQDTAELIRHKQDILKKAPRNKKVSLSWHDMNTSILEAVFARGDRRLGKVIATAYEKGCIFDGWAEYFDFEKWQDCFRECGLDMDFYASRRRSFDEVLPWDHLDFYITKEFLIDENLHAKASQTSPNCREKCLLCGANKRSGEGVCFEKR